MSTASFIGVAAWLAKALLGALLGAQMNLVYIGLGVWVGVCVIVILRLIWGVPRRWY